MSNQILKQLDKAREMLELRSNELNSNAIAGSYLMLEMTLEKYKGKSLGESDLNEIEALIEFFQNGLKSVNEEYNNLEVLLSFHITK